MKKYLVLGVLVLMLPLFVYAETGASTTLSYTVANDASYEWSVPPSVTIPSTVTTNNARQKPGHSAVVEVTATNVTLPAGHQLVVYYLHEGNRTLKNGTSSIPYYINEGEGDAVLTGELANVVGNDRIALLVSQSTESATSQLEITVYEDDIAKATALGEHTDLISFAASVVLDD